MNWKLLRLGDALRPAQIESLQQLAEDDERALEFIQQAVSDRLRNQQEVAEEDPGGFR